MGTLPAPGGNNLVGTRVGDKVFSDQDLKSWWASTGGDANKIAADAVTNNATKDQIAQAIAVGKAQNGDMTGMQYTGADGKAYGGGKAVENYVTDLMPDYGWGENGLLQKKTTPDVSSGGGAVTPGGTTGDTTGWAVTPTVDSANTASPPRLPTTTPGLQENETVEGRIRGLLGSNSPLMKQAETYGMQLANKRGLLDSDLAGAYAVNEMNKIALPIAQQDAGAAQTQRQSLLQGDIQEGLYGVQAGYSSKLSAQDAAQASALSTQKAGESKALNDATIAADNARTMAENNLRISLANLELGSREKSTLGTAVSSLGTTFAENVANIQRDPNVTTENKTKAIGSLESVYKANLGTLAAFYGVELDLGGSVVPTTATTPGEGLLPAPVTPVVDSTQSYTGTV